MATGSSVQPRVSFPLHRSGRFFMVLSKESVRKSSRPAFMLFFVTECTYYNVRYKKVLNEKRLSEPFQILTVSIVKDSM